MEMAVNPLLDRYPLVQRALIVPPRGLLWTVVSFILIFHSPNKYLRFRYRVAALLDKMDFGSGPFPPLLLPSVQLAPKMPLCGFLTFSYVVFPLYRRHLHSAPCACTAAPAVGASGSVSISLTGYVFTTVLELSCLSTTLRGTNWRVYSLHAHFRLFRGVWVRTITVVCCF